MKCSKCCGYGYIDNLEGDGIRCPKCHGLGYVLSVTTIAELRTILEKAIKDGKGNYIVMTGDNGHCRNLEEAYFNDDDGILFL